MIDAVKPYLPWAAILPIVLFLLFAWLYEKARKADEREELKDSANRAHNQLHIIHTGKPMTQEEIDNFPWRD